MASLPAGCPGGNGKMNIPSLDRICIYCKDHPEATATMFEALAVLVSVGIAAVLTYYYNRKQNRKTREIGIKMGRLQRDIDALEKVWSLLAYMSPAESESTILRWQQPKGGGKKSKIYFAHFGNLKRFIRRDLSDVFYHRHAGLFLPDRIRKQVFEYRGILMGLYVRYEKDDKIDDDSLIKLEKPEMIKRLNRIYEQLNADLKAELDRRYRELLALK